MANKTLNIIRQKIASLIAPIKNSMSLPNQFLKYGTRKMFPGWSDVEISDKDLYTGYPYAAIKITANMVAKIASENIYTDSNDDVEHEYLQKIDTSPTFTNREFWSEISTYLDLTGIYYLMVLRNIKDKQYGSVQSFKLLNPYHVKRVLNKETNQVSGYIESENGLVREIPPGMIIEMRELNPFDKNSPFAMTDALKENQFTIKTANDFTRHTLKHNINAPGIITTDVILENEEFNNFTARVKNHTKGEPIFGNGTGAITWENMNVDLRNASLKDINELNREALFAILGVSKTIMGIEQSGVTRETSKTQKDLSIENHVLPRIQLITDALNQDYKNNYKIDYKRNDSNILVKNPTATDYEKDIKEVELKDVQIELYKKLIADGYDEESSAAYVSGDINVEDLVKSPIKKIDKPEVSKPEITKKESIKKIVKKKIVKNKLDKKEKDKSGLIQQQQGALQNAIVNIETQFVSDFMNGIKKLVKNDINEDTGLEDIVTKTEKKESTDELIAVLIAFYGVTMAFNGSSVMKKRVGKYALTGQFILNKEIKDYIKEISKKVAESHITTVGDDLLRIAREAALKGYTQAQIINEIKNKFSYDISETRAKAVARTETNRAFTRSQYEADKQFISQNELGGKCYKKWHTRSDHPCKFCESLANEGMIPFEDSFRDIGGDVTVGKGKEKKILNVDFEKLEAGNLHPNCILPDSIVLAPDTSKILKSEYSGDVIKISTVNGRNITVTPNHIVLTLRGWVAAKNLLKTDSIISYSRWSEITNTQINPTDNQRPSTIEQIFTSAIKDTRVSKSSVPVTAKDFKGDGLLCKGNVDIVSTDGLLGNNTNTSIYECLRNKPLNSGAVDITMPFIKNGNLSSMLIALGLTSDSIVSSDGLSSLLDRVNLNTPEFTSLFNASSYNSRINKSVSNNSSGNSKEISEFLLRLSTLVTADHISNIEIFSYSGHVYDLTTNSSLYINNGLITSNCSCEYELIIKN